MALVTPAQVAAIVNPNINISTTDLSSYIATADLIVNEELSNRGLSTARLTQIELYLAAHFATVTLERGGLARQRIGQGGPEDTYKTIQATSEGFLSTRFGQQAVALDTSGRLGALSKNVIRARFRVAPSPKGWPNNAGNLTDDTTGFTQGDTA